MTAELADDELLNIPLGNLLPGELKRAFRVTAETSAKKQETETRIASTLLAAHQQEEEVAEHEREEHEYREAVLLDRIHDREAEIQQEAAVLDERTIKLHDGRRAYVDGDRFRDAEGKELHGADRAQAEIGQLTQPKAATWQEHEELQRRWETTEQLRHKVEDLQASDTPGADAALAGYEKEFTAHEAAKPVVPNYGSSDYMAAFGLSGTFQASTTGQTASPLALVASQPAKSPKPVPLAP